LMILSANPPPWALNEDERSFPLHLLLIEDSEDDDLLLVREPCRGRHDPDSQRIEFSRDMEATLSRPRRHLVVWKNTMPILPPPGFWANPSL